MKEEKKEKDKDKKDEEDEEEEEKEEEKKKKERKRICMFKVTAACPTYEGKNFPFWKNKMQMHLQAIDNDLWYIVEHGVPIISASVSAADVKKFKQLDSQAKNIICGHLSRGQFGRVSAFGSATLIWERLCKVNEGVSTQRDSRVDVLRNLFNRFKRHHNESCQETFDRLTDISNELQALGARDITDHEVVKKLLRSLDSSFDTLVLMIQERPDYKMLDPADILEMLNTHEFQLEEKKDLYGPRYSRPRALKARAISSSEEEDTDDSFGDPEEFGQELAMLVRKFQRFTRRGQFGKSSRRDMKKSESSSEDYKKRTCHKCKKSGHYIADCPRWGKESKKKKYKDDSSDDSKKKKKSSKSSSSKPSSHKKTSFRKARALICKEMDSEAESEEGDEEEGSDEDSESGQASLALATTFVSKSIFNLEENDITVHTDDYADDIAPTYCFMEKGSKLQKLLDKSDDLLNDEMNLTQILTEDVKSLQCRFDNLQDRYDTLLTDHEKLSYEFIQRKLDLEKLRMSQDDLRTENDSLLAQQISVGPVEFIPPCLKCIECETANSSPESSNATIATNSSTAPVVSISSLEENTNVTDENAGLKELASTNFGIKIQHIRSDNGTEFKNTGLDDYLDELGIIHELSAPYTPQQNGVVERKNRTLVEMARTMLEEYQTPHRFWPEAINTACHIINRVYLHKFLKKTSYELLTDKKPNVSYFKVFGAKCWIRDPHHSSKFAPKAHESFMLGYGKDSHTYRVFNNYHNKVVETVDVRFDETNGSQREQLPSDPDKLSHEEAIKLKPTEDIVPTEEIGEESIPSLMKIKKMLLRKLHQYHFLSPDKILNQLIQGLQMK
ncbi:hypothetical protein ZWY2020_010864 [Hordeum vulgare]|nr:hypothetical protein ZWY2020_010864 [Hordeum vulgare]